MANNNIKQSPNINGYVAYEDWDAATLIKLLWKDGMLKEEKSKQKVGGIYTIYKNEWEQMASVLKALFIKEPKNVTFSKRQLHYFSKNLQLFKPALKVLYTYSDGKNMGRVYPVASLGFTTVRKQIRHTFCRGKWVDIDISNAHPNLLNQMYMKRHQRLNDYCCNRLKYFDLLKQHFTCDGQQYLTNDDVCKSYFIICILYNGGWETWCETNGLPNGVPPPDFHNELLAEMTNIYQDLLVKHQDLANQLNQQKDWNLQGALVSWILQEEERKCLESMVDFATKEKIIPKTKKDRQVVLAYDGFQLRQNAKLNQLFLRKMETYILEQTGYDLKLTTKPFDRGYTDEDLDFEIDEPPPLDELTASAFDMMSEFLELPEDEEEQQTLCQNVYDAFMDTINAQTEVKIAKAIKMLYQGKIVFAGEKTWYLYYRNTWIKDDFDMTRSFISSRTLDVYNKFLTTFTDAAEDGDDEMIEFNKKRCKIIGEIMLRLEKTNDKNNIYREMKEECFDGEFAKQFNIAKDVLPLKGGLLFNLKDNTIRDRTIDDKFDFECPVEFIGDFQNGKAYIKSIFVDDDATEKVFCSVIKSAVAGKNLRKIFICSGSGRNGKSLLFKKLKKIFGNWMDTLSKNLFVQVKQNSSLNTEYEKLEKVRIGYNGEIEDDDKLNQSGIKKISGGDEINLRTLFKTDYTIVSIANLFLNVNSLPNFDMEEAMNDRLVNFPFTAKFPEDASYEAKVDSWLSEIFTYIMLTGELIDAVVPTPAMIIQKQEHQAAQIDCVKDFIADRIIKLEPAPVDTPIKERKTITNRDFYVAFVSWCQQAKQPYPSIIAVGKRIGSLGIRKKEQGGKCYYLDIEFKEDELDEDNEC